MPSRKDIEPADIPHLLANIVLTDVFHDPLAFRYRLVGTGVTAVFGRDSTGKYIDQSLYGSETERMKATFVKVVEMNAPFAVRDIAQFVGKDWMRIDGLLLPLGDRDDRINMILCAIDVTKASGAEISDRKQILLDWRA